MAGVNNEELCGIICVNKPAGFTSFDVIAKMRGILKMKKLGHGGTLDPMAVGVLPVFAGRATKACDMLPDHDKTYEAGFRLGAVSDTQDSTGTVTEKGNIDGIGSADILNVMEGFRGDIMQIPPMYSAVSVGGKRLYDLARQGVEVERQPRPVTIYSLELLAYDEKSGEGRLSVSCSKGTYIRTLINDIGEKLGCGGIMTSLVRTRACGFSLSDCVTLEQLQEMAASGGDFSTVIKPIEQVFAYLPELRIKGAQERMYHNGVKLDLDRLRFDRTAPRVRVYGENGFIGIAAPDTEKGILRVEKNF
ncbi:MAG: tRNA pseudouridine(55) synthase TruB [Oscillospiraceae bacterium]|nr:tRNA pseudouridine(55) synthase TruB [Oscillospiraceae bacterium]